jgi:hypothetical protein
MHGLCQVSVGRKSVGELSDAQMEGRGQIFSLEPELQMCRTCSTIGFCSIGGEQKIASSRSV